MPGFAEGYNYHSAELERYVAAAQQMHFDVKRVNVSGFDSATDGNGQYNMPKKKEDMAAKYGHSKAKTTEDMKYAKAGRHPLDNRREVAKLMVAEGGDLSKQDEFNALSLAGVARFSDVSIEVNAAIDNKMGERMHGWKMLDGVQQEEVVEEAESHDGRKIGGSDLGYYKLNEGHYQGGHRKFQWLEMAQRRTSDYDQGGGKYVENEHVQMEWLAQSKGYDPALAWAGPGRRPPVV